MFFPGSRYSNLSTYQVVQPDGSMVTATRLPLPANPPILGSFPRQNQRLDVIAYHFFKDATAFSKLCDANNSIVPDALGAHRLIAIPGQPNS